MSDTRIEAACDAFAREAEACGLGSLGQGGAPGKVVRCVAAALSAADQAGWSTDMEAAPKHATLLDLWCPTSHAYAVRGRFWEQDGQWLEEESTRVLRPRAWRVLPALPPAPGDAAP